MRKPRSDSKLAHLPEDQRQALTDWLLAGTAYRVVKGRLLSEFGVSTSDDALCRFWNDYCGAALIARRQRAVSLADEVAAEAAREPGRFDAATIDALKQKAFELAVNPQSDPRDVKGLFMLVLKSRDQELERAKFEESVKGNVERAIEAFLTEIKGDAEAEDLVRKLRGRVLDNLGTAA